MKFSQMKNHSLFVLAQLSASTIECKLKILESCDTGKMENRRWVY